MKRDPVTIAPDAPIEAAAKLMRDRRIGSLPVVRGKGLAGLITESDIFRIFVSLFHDTPHSTRITFDMSKGEDIATVITELATEHDVRIVSFFSYMQDNAPVCVVRVIGSEVERFVDALWRSKHPVLNVLHVP